MLRELQNIVSTPANAMYKASESMVSGMGVVKSTSAKTVGLPEAETVDVVFVQKGQAGLTGADAIYNMELPDYDDKLNNIATGEFVKFKTYLAGESVAVDQFTTGIVKGDRMSVGTDGKWMKATNTLASNFVCDGTVTDCGRTLTKINIVADFATNA